MLAKIAEMPEPDRAMAERLHTLTQPVRWPFAARLWYGMPAYANDGKVVCFFQSAQKFKTRYSTLGFNDQANIDDGDMWPTAYALTELTCRRGGKGRRARQESGELSLSRSGVRERTCDRQSAWTRRS